MPSDHDVFGWGGPGGRVYQKAYVECFMSPGHLGALMHTCERHPSMTYYAVDAIGNTYTNSTSRVRRPLLSFVATPWMPPAGLFDLIVGVCAVVQSVQAITWGVFPGREVIQPTIVDPDTFLVWKVRSLRDGCGATLHDCCVHQLPLRPHAWCARDARSRVVTVNVLISLLLAPSVRSVCRRSASRCG